MEIINQLNLAEVILRAARVRDGETDKDALDRVTRLMRCHLMAFSAWGEEKDLTYNHIWLFSDGSSLFVNELDELSVQKDVDVWDFLKIYGGYFAVGGYLQKIMDDGRLEQWASDIFNDVNGRNEVTIELEPHEIEVSTEDLQVAAGHPDANPAAPGDPS